MQTKLIHSKADTCIIGAGIAGLLAAESLQAEGQHVVVVDKGRGVGGRMSVRRFADARFDHGAQFFSVKDQQFRSLLDNWKDLGLVEYWSNGFETFDGTVVNSGQPYYRGRTGMNEIARHISKALDVRILTSVTQISYQKGHWLLKTETGERFQARSLIMTPPVPQTVKLLQNSHFRLSDTDSRALSGIEYDRCLAFLAVLKGTSNLPHPGGMFGPGEPIHWIADNAMKGISAGGSAITIHCGPKFSREHWEASSATIENLLVAAVKDWLGSKIVQYQIHRWRYSKPVQIHAKPYYVVDTPGPLILAGDAFGGPRVEGAALSGLAAAKALLERSS